MVIVVIAHVIDNDKKYFYRSDAVRDKNMTHLKYRPEIDGLRAVSVMLVILHHLGFSVVSGGYVGVDVFFVISGYLITRIVVGEMQAGSFSFAIFYKRRIIRLAPAYFLVLAVTSVASAVVMLPAELLAYFKSVIFSTLFSANFFMWREVAGYFAEPASRVPLLHLWSLAVEEQFYIFWPPALLILLRFAKPKYVWGIVAIAALICLWASEWGVNNYRAAAYYLMPTRAFELLIGALVAVMPRVQMGARAANGVTLLGFVLVIVPGVAYSKETLFPGLSALVPCLGAALIIAFANHQNNWVGRILASAPLNFVGRISYPAYLWHWPLIVFLKIHLIDIDAYLAVAVIVATLLLSTLTYWYIEIPFKGMQSFKLIKVAGIGFALPATAFLLVSGAASASKGWPQRFDNSLNVKSEAIFSYSNKIRGRCHEGNVSNPLPPDECILGINKPGVDILLIGDSHANHFTGMIDVMAKDAGLRGYDITQSNTIYLPDARLFEAKDSKKEKVTFYARNQVIKQEINQGKYKYVVLGGKFSRALESSYSLNKDNTQNEGVFHSQLEKSVKEIIGAGAIVFIIKGVPQYAYEVQNCTINNQRFGLKNNCNMEIKEYQNQFFEWNTFLSYLVKKYPSVSVIDPALIVCNRNSCFSEINGVPLYRDWSHLNHIGSKYVGELYLKQFGNPFKGNLAAAVQTMDLGQ
jgi:peptidoglycan/LPS O-acetylase OafA/YrhL